MLKVNNKDIRTTSMASFWHLYCKLLTCFSPCFSVSFVNFEHVFAGWVPVTLKKVLKTFGSSGRLTMITKQFDITVPIVTVYVKIFGHH